MFRAFPLSLGGVPLAHPFTLAALSGYSDLGLRVVCRQLGASLTRNEVVLDTFVLEAGRQAGRGGRALDDEDHPVCAQLMGSEPGPMAAAAQRMVSYGYDVVDINFGCPVKKVLGRCRGGFLLGDPATALEMVKQVRDAVAVPVTVKMRLGTDETPAAEDAFWRILDGAVALGIAAVAVHGRTVKQNYEGVARWERLRAIKARHPALPVFGSGDLFTAEDCLRMLTETGIEGVTIARGAIANPWIFRECLALFRGEPLPPPPTLAEQGELMDRQYQLAIRQYGPDKASRQMRKFGIKRAPLHPRAAEVHQVFVKLNSPEEWHAARQRLYSSDERPERPTELWRGAWTCADACG
jgi:tRNA-dihydrouridine synthase B